MNIFTYMNIYIKYSSLASCPPIMVSTAGIVATLGVMRDHATN